MGADCAVAAAAPSASAARRGGEKGIVRLWRLGSDESRVKIETRLGS